jgi:hypothetical protein
MICIDGRVAIRTVLRLPSAERCATQKQAGAKAHHFGLLRGPKGPLFHVTAGSGLATPSADRSAEALRHPKAAEARANDKSPAIRL